MVMGAMLDVQDVESARIFMIGSYIAGSYFAVGWVALVLVPYIVGFILDQSYFTSKDTWVNVVDLSIKAVSPLVPVLASFDSLMVAIDTALMQGSHATPLPPTPQVDPTEDPNAEPTDPNQDPNADPYNYQYLSVDTKEALIYN